MRFNDFLFYFYRIMKLNNPERKDYNYVTTDSDKMDGIVIPIYNDRIEELRQLFRSLVDVGGK